VTLRLPTAASPAPSSPQLSFTAPAATVPAVPTPIGGILTSPESERELEQVREWARSAAQAADDKGATDTVVLEVGAIIAITDAFVVTSGRNHRQVVTVAEEVEARLKGSGLRPLRMEGMEEAEWVLLDYGDFVVHVFLDETRRYYDLERLWSDAPRIEWSSATAPAPAGRTAE
jgi:ribosome-associated protein